MAAVVLTATAFPVVSLLWASRVSKAEVEHKATDGLVATAKATVLQEQQAWDDAVRVVTSAASGPVLGGALGSHDTLGVVQSAQSVLFAGPFADVRIFDPAGRLTGMAALDGVAPSAVVEVDNKPTTFGEPVTAGTQTTRQVNVGIWIGEAQAGRLVVDVEMTLLLGRPADLAFGRTGAKLLVTSSGMIVAGSADVGGPLHSAVNRRVAAAAKPATMLIHSPFYNRLTVESYEPIPDQQLGILVQQARSEVMRGADRLAARQRWVAVAVAVLGSTLAASLGVFLGRRGRRLVDSEGQLADSQAESSRRGLRLADSEGRLAHSKAESTRRLEQFLDAMPIGVVAAAPDGRTQYVNREAERLLGRGIVPGSRSSELVVLSRAQADGISYPFLAAEMPMGRALRGETSYSDDIEIRRPQGSVPVEVWATPVLARDKSVEFGITAFADVSERRRVAEEIQLLSAITANMSEGVVLVQMADNIVAYANSSFEAMFGYGPAELVGRNVVGLNAPGRDPPEKTASITSESLRKTGRWRGEVRNIRKDGTTFWCAVNVTLLDHPRFGQVSIAVHSDITAHRQAQEAQARLASIVQGSGEAIVAKTLDGIVTSWNPAAEQLFGYTAAEMIGGPIQVLIPPEARNEEVDLRGRVARGLGVEHYETVHLRKDGTSVDVSVTMSPIEDDNGTITGIANIVRDINERKRARAAIAEREEHLRSARDHALEASRLKSQFLANMSHEIRTPMNGVLGMAQLLLTGNLEPEQRRRVLNLQEAGHGLLTIINDILDFSKMEAGKLELEAEKFDLVAAAENALGLLSGLAHDKGLTLTMQVGPGVPRWVRGDSVRLRQVLINILGNAVKFTERGGVGLHVGLPALGRLRFTVRDTGIGIDPSGTTDLLEPFSQGDASTTRRFGGTGLGLAICRQLVELMGGSLHFTSGPDAGATFWFDVKLAAAEPDDPAAVGGVPVAWRKADRGLGARILLADDAEINREVGKGLLESLGFEVDTVSSGAEAIAAVRRVDYAAILMDCLMPVMDGYEATTRIRAADGPTRHTPIIALTAAAMSGDRERCLAAGMDDYVSKPLDLDLLMGALARSRPGLAGKPPPLNGGPNGGADGRLNGAAPAWHSTGNDDADRIFLERLELLGHRLPADALGRICRLFLATTPGLIAGLGAAVRAGDTDGAIGLAHNLKGSMAMVGAQQLSDLAKQVELGEREGLVGFDTVLGEIDDAYDRARAVVVSLLPEGASD